MFVLYKKSTKLDGTAPYLQYGKVTIFLHLGYGSNKVPFVSIFCPLLLTFADTFKGVVSSIPNICGGLGFGSSWSDAAGSKAYKVNSVDDFISATFVSRLHTEGRLCNLLIQ